MWNILCPVLCAEFSCGLGSALLQISSVSQNTLPDSVFCARICPVTIWFANTGVVSVDIFPSFLGGKWFKDCMKQRLEAECIWNQMPFRNELSDNFLFVLILMWGNYVSWRWNPKFTSLPLSCLSWLEKMSFAFHSLPSISFSYVPSQGSVTLRKSLSPNIPRDYIPCFVPTALKW